MTTHLSNPVSRTPSQPAGILFNNANNNVNNLPRVRPPLIEEDVPDPPAPGTIILKIEKLKLHLK